MKKRDLLPVVLAILLGVIGAACLWGESQQPRPEKSSAQAEHAAVSQNAGHQPITLELLKILKQKPTIRSLLEQSLAKAKEQNPDPQTNPAQTLEQYLAYLDWCGKAMPWNALADAGFATLYEQIDQSLCYFYFLLDQPLPELENKGYYYASLQYLPELQPWVARYAKEWGSFLSTPESWNSQYAELARQEKRFGLDKDWYEEPSHWHSFNDFFARRLRSPQMRPIAMPADPSLLVSPADSIPQGLWHIDEQSQMLPQVQLKSTAFLSVAQLLGDGSAYGEAFTGGTLTHCFLNVDDYHRYHFPIEGIIREVEMMPAQDAAGGLTLWDPLQKKYVLHSREPGWQTLETRARVVVETPDFGLVALLPIGMSQVSSIVLEPTVQVGSHAEKGDMLGCFYFGGSDFVMIFQRGVQVRMLPAQAEDGKTYAHVLMGEPYARLSKEGEQAQSGR